MSTNSSSEFLPYTGRLIDPTNAKSRGFAAKTSAKGINTVQAMGEDWNALIEEDKGISISGSSH